MDDKRFPPNTRADEIALWEAFPTPECPYPYEAGMKLGMTASRVSYLCRKWQLRGWYKYGVTAELGEKIDNG